MASMFKYESLGAAGPTATLSSASPTCGVSLSASEYTATVAIPSFSHVRMTRRAISPRLAMRTFLNMGRLVTRPPKGRQRPLATPRVPLGSPSNHAGKEDRARRDDGRPLLETVRHLEPRAPLPFVDGDREALEAELALRCLAVL